MKNITGSLLLAHIPAVWYAKKEAEHGEKKSQETSRNGKEAIAHPRILTHVVYLRILKTRGKTENAVRYSLPFCMTRKRGNNMRLLNHTWNPQSDNKMGEKLRMKMVRVCIGNKMAGKPLGRILLF